MARPKLSPDFVRRVRAWRETRRRTGLRTPPTVKKLAGEAGIHIATLYEIADRKIYRWVE